MSQSPAPEITCSVAGCTEPAVVEHRGAAADPVLDAPAADIVAVCADHAAEENAAGNAG